ncbi:MAG: serine/threonine protein kinase, partial [Planctomycetes bacterium]|nr:serine/threonine protein kinase [Planctomycetota bacterium]
MSPERASRRLSRRHPDIEVARLLVKHGLLEKSQAVVALKEQKRRAKETKPRVPFLRFLLKREFLNETSVQQARDLIREHTYICEACDARAVIVAGSQTRGGLCPRCGAEISVDGTLLPPAAARVAQSDTEPWPRRARPEVPEQGQTVFGRYKLLEEIGRGAMGVVYRARHHALDKDVALKLLTPSEEGHDHQVARFRREAAAVQKLRHPGIIPVHDFGNEGEVYYLTMDLVEGARTLHSALKNRDQPVPLPQRLQLMIEVARAVHHAHERGVIHRDLKPANVLITPEGKAQVVDFGLAKDEDDAQGELTRTHDRLGTPLFMAPEQIRRGASEVDARADVWALGVMLFVCATGRYPFRSRTVMDLYLRIMREPPDWTGARYSAPDRRLPPNPFVSSEDLVVEETLSEERTEISSRKGADGKLPETLSPAPTGLPLPPPFAPPPELREGPDKVLRSIIECALAKAPEDRYASAEDLALDLERYLAGKGTLHARRPPLIKRLKRQLRRPRVLVALAAASVVLASGLGLALYSVAAEARSVRETRIADALGAGEPDDPEGRIAYYRGAQARVQKLLEDYPDDATLLRAAGTFHLRELEVEPAREELQRALNLAQDPAVREGALRELVLADSLLGDHRQALARGLASLQQIPSPEPATVRRVAEACFAVAQLTTPGPEFAQQRAQVELALKAALEAKEAPPQLRAYYARMALLAGDADAAEGRLPRPEQGGPKEHFSVELVRGAIALRRGQAELAEAAFERAASVWRSREGELQGDVATYNLQGLEFKRDKDAHRSVLANRAAAFLAPYHPFPLYYVARTALTLAADLNRATEYARLAHEANPFSESGLDFLLALLEAQPELRRQQRAVLDQARALAPKAPGLALRAAYLAAREARRGD